MLAFAPFGSSLFRRRAEMDRGSVSRESLTLETCSCMTAQATGFRQSSVREAPQFSLLRFSLGCDSVCSGNLGATLASCIQGMHVIGLYLRSDFNRLHAQGAGSQHSTLHP